MSTFLKSNNDKNDTDRLKQEFVASDNINLKEKKKFLYHIWQRYRFIKYIMLKSKKI